MRSVFMPPGLTVLDFARLDSISSSTRLIKYGTSLYRERDPFRNIYTILAGSFKTVVRHPDGRNQVTGFQLVCDTLGLDGVYTSHHNCEAIAIEDSLVCIIPFYLLEHLCSEVKAIQQHVHRMMSGEIVRESALMMFARHDVRGSTSCCVSAQHVRLPQDSRLLASGIQPANDTRRNRQLPRDET
jgi:CRP/FNR family transcriptional regulator